MRDGDEEHFSSSNSLLLLLPFAETQDALAQADGVAGLEGCRAADEVVVEVGSRAFVDEDVAIALAADARVELLDLGIAEEADVATLGSTDGDLRLG